MKKFFIALFVLLVLVFVLYAQRKISEYPNVAVPHDSDLFLLASTNAGATNKNIKWSDVKLPLEKTNVLLHAAPTNGFVSAKVLIAGAGVSLTTINNTNLSISTSGAEYYVDSVMGLDSNNGLGPGTAWKTIGQITNALGTSLNSLKLNLARGSHWREQLTLGTNNIVRAFGSGARPILNASDHATNSLWQKVDGFVNMWAISNWCIITGPPTYISVAENGIQLIRSNTLAGVDATPGTFFAVDDPTAGSCTNIVYIHPRGSTTPTNDFKLYEIAARSYGLFGGNDNTVEDVHALGPSLSNNGVFELALNALVRRCIFENGTKHNTLLASGVIEDTIAWKQEYNNQASSLFVNFTTFEDQATIIYRRCIAMGHPDFPAHGDGFFGHTINNLGYKFVLHEDCGVEFANQFGVSGIGTNGLAIANRCWGRGLVLAGWSTFGGTNIFLEPSFFSTPAVSLAGNASGILINGNNSQVFVSGGLIAGVPFSIQVVSGVTNCKVEVHQSYLNGSGNALFINGTNNTCIISNTVMQDFGTVYNIATNNTITAANSNVLEFFAITYNGTNYTSWATFQTHYPNLEVGSKTNDIQNIGDPSQGDFRFANTSPAVTNQAGPGWTITRRPLISDVRFSDTLSFNPNRQAGSIWLEGQFRSATNEIASTFANKLNKTNDTAFRFQTSGDVTNGAFATIQMNATGNGTVRLNKAGAGNISQYIQSAAGTDLSRFATDTAGTSIIETLNSSEMYILALSARLRIFGTPLQLFGDNSTLAARISGNDAFFADTVTVTNTLTVKGIATLETNLVGLGTNNLRWLVITNGAGDGKILTSTNGGVGEWMTPTVYDSITVDGAAATDANFISTLDITNVLDTGTSPDTVTLRFLRGVTLGGDPALAASHATFSTTGIIFEGATADTIEGLLAVADPTATDKTWTLPNATGTVVLEDNTATLTGKTLDASATGNVLKFKSYMDIQGFDLVSGATVPNTNDLSQATFMKVVFSNSADETANYFERHLMVPDDWDTGVDPRVKLTFKLNGADTGTHRYVVSMASVANSTIYTGTVGNAINNDFAGDGSGANNDVEQVGFTTLTGWGSAVTPGQHWVIRVARDGNATQDGSTVDSTMITVRIEYGVTQ